MEFMLLPLLVFALQDHKVADSATNAKPLQAGATAPDSSLKDMDGKPTSVKKVLAGEKTVLVFFRGGWCPFCNAQLADLGQSESKVIEAGWKIVAITPDTPEQIRKTVDKQKLSFQIYSDSPAEALKAFGVAFRVDDETYSLYKDKYKLDLETWSGQRHHILPVPSVYLIDEEGKIRFSYSNPDYKVRLKSGQILEEIHKLDGKR